MTYFIFRSLVLKKTTMVAIMTSLLVVSLIMERYCFLVTVYKTKYYGYVLIPGMLLKDATREELDEAGQKIYDIEFEYGGTLCFFKLIFRYREL